jgi:hypothetical protein
VNALARLQRTPEWLFDLEIDGIVHTQAKQGHPEGFADEPLSTWGTQRVRNLLDDLLDDWRGRRPVVSLHLPDEEWTVARVPVSKPNAAAAEIETHLESELPQPLERYAYAAHVCETAGVQVAHVFVCARDTVDNIAGRVRDRKFTLKRVQPRIVSLVNAAAHAGLMNNATTLLVDRSAGALSVAVLRGAALDRVRILPFGDPEDDHDDIDLAQLHATAEAYAASRQAPIRTLVTPGAAALLDAAGSQADVFAAEPLHEAPTPARHLALTGLALTGQATSKRGRNA